MELIFKDRRDAGKKVAAKLSAYRAHPNTIVLGLARGGIVVAHAIGEALKLPVDVLCPRKIGAPYNPELAVGAVTEDGSVFLNEDIRRHLGLSVEMLSPITERARQEAERQVALYRRGRPPLDLTDKIVIIADDGLATGATMRAAIAQVKKAKAKKIIVAVPVAPPDTWEEIGQLVDEGYVLLLPYDFAAVGAFYENFASTPDEEVLRCLK
jgi:putative phosphoribosyl transferase